MAVDEQEQSPFTKPGFVVASLVVAVIVVLGVFLGIRSATGDEESGGPPDTTSASPSSTSSSTTSSAEPSASGAEASVCGLDGRVLSGRISTAPEAAWEYQDTMAYPISKDYGPAKTNAEGVRYCFQHSPEGALFAAANAVVQGSGTTKADWINHFLSSETPNRSQFLPQNPTSATTDARLNIEGFRVLSYEGNTARVDVAVRVSSAGNQVYMSSVYDLVWEGGDWKFLPSNASDPLPTTQIPDLAGYTGWNE